MFIHITGTQAFVLTTQVSLDPNFTINLVQKMAYTKKKFGLGLSSNRVTAVHRYPLLLRGVHGLGRAEPFQARACPFRQSGWVGLFNFLKYIYIFLYFAMFYLFFLGKSILVKTYSSRVELQTFYHLIQAQPKAGRANPACEHPYSLPVGLGKFNQQCILNKKKTFFFPSKNRFLETVFKKC